MGDFEVRNSLMIMVCIALFEVIHALQRRRLCQSHATAFSLAGMDKCMTISANWKVSAFVAPSSSIQSVVSGKHLYIGHASQRL